MTRSGWNTRGAYSPAREMQYQRDLAQERKQDELSQKARELAKLLGGWEQYDRYCDEHLPGLMSADVLIERLDAAIEEYEVCTCAPDATGTCKACRALVAAEIGADTIPLDGVE